MPAPATLDLDLNWTSGGWTVFYLIGAALWSYVSWRCWQRQQLAENVLAPESVLHGARLFTYMSTTIAFYSWINAFVGVCTIFRFTDPIILAFLTGGALINLAALIEITGIRAMAISSRREAADGLWDQMPGVQRSMSGASELPPAPDEPPRRRVRGS